MTRHGVPIEDHAIRNRVKHGISHSQGYLAWDAAIAAGASLTELLQWDRTDKFPSSFKAKVVAWHIKHNEIEAHISDAAQPKKKA